MEGEGGVDSACLERNAWGAREVASGVGSDADKKGHEAAGAFAPLRLPVFRGIWSSSVISNHGHLVLGVAAAWEMTRLTNAPAMVALVQTALMLPLMLVAVPAGAIADMFDRRKVALCGLAVACLGGLGLAAIGFGDLLTPWLLLASLVVIGAGVALYSPAWQASVSELVPAEQLPAAVALGSVSYNLARSFGPALGGLIVVAGGAKAAFAVSALGYAPLILALALWQRKVAPARLPPESFSRAVISGVRFSRHASAVRNAIVRSFLFGFAGATAGALAPLIARDQLSGDASTYGLLLGASGIGAVLGSLVTARLWNRPGPENTIRLATVAAALAYAGIALSSSTVITAALFAVQGMTTMMVFSMLNVGVQLAVPRWVTARAMSLFSAALSGGIALGAIAWGAAAQAMGMAVTIELSAGLLAVTALVGFALPVRRSADGEGERYTIEREPEVALSLSARSGPIVIEVDYRIEVEQAREFYRAMQDVRKARSRNGAFGWTLSRDISDAELWTERYVCPTWGDYLHLRDRFTQGDRAVQDRVEALNSLQSDCRVRRRLERPYGSVRWKAETPDSGTDKAGAMLP